MFLKSALGVGLVIYSWLAPLAMRKEPRTKQKAWDLWLSERRGEEKLSARTGNQILVVRPEPDTD